MSDETVDIVSDISVPADATVLALGIVMKGGKKPVESLQQGKALCEHVLTILEPGKEAKTTSGEADREQLLTQLLSTFSTEYDAVQFFMETQGVLVRLLESDEAVSSDDLCEIQQKLVACSMSSWRERHLEFRQRRLKRRLKRYG